MRFEAEYNGLADHESDPLASEDVVVLTIYWSKVVNTSWGKNVL